MRKMKKIEFSNIKNTIFWALIISLMLFCASVSQASAYVIDSYTYTYQKYSSPKGLYISSYSWSSINNWQCYITWCVDGLHVHFTSDWQYGYYLNWNKLYKKTNVDNSVWSPVIASNPDIFAFTLSRDNSYIFYWKSSDNKLYRKSSGDTLDGTIWIGSNLLYNNIDLLTSPDWLYLYYVDASAGKIWKKSTTDTLNWSAISATWVYPLYWWDISPDGLSITYSHSSSVLWSMPTNGVSDWALLLNNASYPAYSYDWNSLIFSSTVWSTYYTYKAPVTNLSSQTQITNIWTTYKKVSPTSWSINGSCGTAAGTYPAGSTTYSGSLCSAGTPSWYISFPGPWDSVTYSCVWSGGWNTVTCSISQDTADWECWNAAGIYPATATDYTWDLCAIGTPSWYTYFPIPGATAYYTCLWIGWNSVTCSITHWSYYNGACGSAAGVYPWWSVEYSGDLCAAGTPEWYTGFPALWETTTYSCVWTSLWDTATCSIRQDIYFVNGTCGTAAGEYPEWSTTASWSYCATGTPYWQGFPIQWGYSYYTCLWSGGGNSTNCSIYVQEAVFACNETGINTLICPFQVVGRVWDKFTAFLKLITNIIYWIWSFGSPKWTWEIISYIWPIFPVAYADDLWEHLPNPWFDGSANGNTANSYTWKDMMWLNKAMLKAWDSLYNLKDNWWVKWQYRFVQWMLILIWWVVVFVIFLTAFV